MTSSQRADDRRVPVAAAVTAELRLLDELLQCAELRSVRGELVRVEAENARLRELGGCGA